MKYSTLIQLPILDTFYRNRTRHAFRRSLIKTPKQRDEYSNHIAHGNKICRWYFYAMMTETNIQQQQQQRNEKERKRKIENHVYIHSVACAHARMHVKRRMQSAAQASKGEQFFFIYCM